MNTKKLIYAIFICFIGFLPFHVNTVDAYVQSIGYTSNNYTSTAGGSLLFEVTCQAGVVLNQTVINLQSISTVQTVDVKIDGVLLATTTPPTAASSMYTVNWSNKVCSGLQTYILEFDVTTAGTIRSRVNQNGGIYTTDQFKNDLLMFRVASTTDMSVNSTSYSLLFATSSVSSGTSTSMATTTIISANDPLVSFTLIYFIFVLTLAVGVGILYPLFLSRKR